MKTVSLVVLNLSLIGLFVFLIRRCNLFPYSQNGRLWLTYLAVAIITLMDDFTSKVPLHQENGRLYACRLKVDHDTGSVDMFS
jgi:hypothetical protein